MSSIVPFREGMKVGVGYDRLTGDAKPSPAVTWASVSGPGGADGQVVTLDCLTIEDVELLHKTLGVGVDASGSYLGFSASAKVDYLSRLDLSRFSTYVLIRLVVQNASKTVDDPRFTDDAVELIKNNNAEKFRKRFGDAFIAGLKTGGEYFALYQFTSTDRQEREDIAGDVRAGYDNPLLFAASVGTKINDAVQRSVTHLEAHVHVFRQGTISDAGLDLATIMAQVRTFPGDVSGNESYAYAALLQDYDALHSPNDAFNPIEIQHQRDVLADYARKRIEFVALRDDLTYAGRHPDDFENADGSTVDVAALDADRIKVISVLNTMDADAAACSRDAGACSFPTDDVAQYRRPVLKPSAADPTVPVWVRRNTPGLPQFAELDIGSGMFPDTTTTLVSTDNRLWRLDDPVGSAVQEIAPPAPGHIRSVSTAGSSVCVDGNVWSRQPAGTWTRWTPELPPEAGTSSHYFVGVNVTVTENGDVWEWIWTNTAIGHWNHWTVPVKLRKLVRIDQSATQPGVDCGLPLDPAAGLIWRHRFDTEWQTTDFTCLDVDVDLRRLLWMVSADGRVWTSASTPNERTPQPGAGFTRVAGRYESRFLATGLKADGSLWDLTKPV